MGKLSRTIKQIPFPVGTLVYFEAFTKSRTTGTLKCNKYFCQGKVLVSPSQYTKSPHKVIITKVMFNLSIGDSSEQDGRKLLNKEIHLPFYSLKTEVPALLAKNKWWI